MAVVTSKIKRVSKDGEPLVRVQVAPLVYVKMRQSEAVAIGMIPDPDTPVEKPQPKRRKPAQNKQRTIENDKGGDDEE